jgi:hypothetical protein
MAAPLLRPPFTRNSAIEKVRLAEDGWNSRDPEKVSLPTLRIPGGGTAPSSAGSGEVSRSFGASGQGSWTTG